MRISDEIKNNKELLERISGTELNPQVEWSVKLNEKISITSRGNGLSFLEIFICIIPIPSDLNLLFSLMSSGAITKVGHFNFRIVSKTSCDAIYIVPFLLDRGFSKELKKASEEIEFLSNLLGIHDPKIMNFDKLEENFK